ncbi:transcriptional regulator [Kordiimonas aquimaris]|uniref:transcriptional regulator n=1 Tax=Kordiimonas aquimaris TaxID=707591 RepID=UPI0021D17BB0|nr:LuxR family transcriptional regulator [Kordiimonas aquimaris]
MIQHAGISADKLQVWNAAVLSALNKPDKIGRLSAICDGVKNTIDICFAAVFVLHRRSAPTCIFDEVEDDGSLSDYVDFAYLLDPIYDRFLAGTLPTNCLMRDSAPDDFFSSEYYQKYYGQLGIQDEFYFNMIMDADTVIHITLTRVNNQTPFTPMDLDTLRALEPVVKWVVDDYWQDFAQPHKDSAGEKQKEHDAVTQAFETFGASVLTARERQIVQLMLKGFSDKSTARILEISPGTVRNHKKSIFGKLDVTSQGQVFGLFLDALAASSSNADIT